jgi:YidC/Oxa1 family membrane protein insertase
MFTTLLVNPLYNGFVGLLDVLPFLDAGIVIIIFTSLVSLVLYPTSRKALTTQVKMKQHESELKEIKEKYARNKEEQARRMLAFYREKGINPFAGLVVILIQLPVVIALYYVFFRAGLPAIDAGRLYDFIPVPTSVNMQFLGLVDISQKSVFLAALAGLAQFVQAWYSPALALAAQKKRKAGEKPSFEESFASSMRVQMRYVFPIIIFMISYQYTGVIALYLATRSTFTFAQELVMRRQMPSTGHPKTSVSPAEPT